MMNDDNYDDILQYLDIHDYINKISIRLTDSYLGRVFHKPKDKAYYIVTSVTWSLIKLVNTMDKNDTRMETHEDLLNLYSEKL